MEQISNSNANKVRILGISSVIIAIALILVYILFMFPRLSQIYYWPYEFPAPMIYLGQFLFWGGWILIGFAATILIYVGLKLILAKSVLTHPNKKIKQVQRMFFLFVLMSSIGGTSVLTYFGAGEVPYWLYDAGPYLTWTTNQDPTTEITISWHSALASGSEVKYGTLRESLTERVTKTQLSQFHHIMLTDLLPNTTYYYQAGNFPIKQFTTAPQQEHNFSVLFWSDPRTNDPAGSALKSPNIIEIMGNYLKNSSQEIAFSICGGDITSRGVDYQTWKIWLKDITTNDFASNRSHAVAFGNHERHDDLAARNLPNYYPYVAAPVPQAFSYSFTYGNTHFVMLDRWASETGWYGGDDQVYAEWLENDLKQNNNTKFTILSMHPNPVLNDGHSGDCTKIMKVAEKYGVDLILSGHWHSYNTYHFNGTPYTPTDGINSLDQLVLMLGLGGNEASRANPSFAQLNITPDLIEVQIIDKEYHIINRFQIG
jgi:hypothetical protein